MSKGDLELADSSGEIMQVRLHRVFADPIILSDRGWDELAGEYENVVDDVYPARLRLAKLTPADEIIKRATIPEVILFLSSASMNARLSGGDVPPLLQLAITEYNEQYDTNNDVDLGELNDVEYYRGKLDNLRKSIKDQQDEHFIETRYSDLGLDQVPKSRWQ